MPLDLVKDEYKPDWVGRVACTDANHAGEHVAGTSPYDSTWYVHFPKNWNEKKFFDQLEKHPCNKNEWLVAGSLKGIYWKKKSHGRQKKNTEHNQKTKSKMRKRS